MALERPDDVVEHAFAYDARYADLGDVIETLADTIVGDGDALAGGGTSDVPDDATDEDAPESAAEAVALENDAGAIAGDEQDESEEDDQMTVDTQDEVRYLMVRKQAVNPGPLAPYRFAITLLFAAAVGTGPLSTAFNEGVGIEGALIRTFGAGVLMWVATGLVNMIFVKSAEARAAAETEAASAALGELGVEPNARLADES